MGIRLNYLLICLFLTLCSALFSEITKEQILEKEWFSLEANEGVKNDLIGKLLALEQGQLLFQALIYQQECLNNKGIHFSIHIVIQPSGNNETNFIYNEEDDEFSAKIILKSSLEGKILTMHRPILIKQNDFYRLYQLEIPDFIILAHELLHALNHAELFASNEIELINAHKKISSLINSDTSIDIVPRRNAIQEFLRKKLLLPSNHTILQSPYKEFWENYYATETNKNDLGDSLDEMTTILCSYHEIASQKRVRIGETLLLREYYKRYEIYKNLISWSHFCVENNMLFKDNNYLLNSTYVNTRPPAKVM